jgi:hypothetical protein
MTSARTLLARRVLVQGLGNSDFSASVFPELLQLVIVPCSGPENVDNDSTVIEEDPAGVAGAFFVEREDIFAFEAFGYRINQRFYLPCAFAGTNDEVVGKTANSLSIKQNNIGGLFIT